MNAKVHCSMSRRDAQGRRKPVYLVREGGRTIAWWMEPRPVNDWGLGWEAGDAEMANVHKHRAALIEEWLNDTWGPELPEAMRGFLKAGTLGGEGRVFVTPCDEDGSWLPDVAGVPDEPQERAGRVVEWINEAHERIFAELLEAA